MISGVLRLAPQLAAFASSLGVTTRLVTTVGHESAAALWAACAIEREMPLRQGLYVGDRRMGRPSTSRSTVVVLDRNKPSFGEAPLSEATILSVAAATPPNRSLLG